MTTKIILAIFLLAFTITSFGQNNISWEKWNRLIGEWKGEGGGQPGQGGGTFSFSFDLDNKIVVRKSHSFYPATDNKPEVIHDDLMIIYPDGNTDKTKAIYFDNEGHIINYDVTYTDRSITLTSIKVPDSPVFRLTYTLLENEILNTKFEMSRDGINYITYIEGNSKKIK